MATEKRLASLEQGVEVGLVGVEALAVEELHILKVLVSRHADCIRVGILHHQRRHSSWNFEFAKFLAVKNPAERIPFRFREFALIDLAVSIFSMVAAPLLRREAVAPGNQRALLVVRQGTRPNPRKKTSYT